MGRGADPLAIYNLCLILKIMLQKAFPKYNCNIFLTPYIYIYIYTQGDSRLVGIIAGGDFLGLCDQKSSYKYVSDFGRLRSYDRLKLGIEGNDY